MKKYYIVLLYDSEEIESTFQTDSPKTALNKWFKYSQKRPMMANISCGSVEDCMALYSEFLKNVQEYSSKYWLSGNRFYLKFDYVYNTCNAYIHGGKKPHFLGRKEFYDSVHPFCYG